MVGDHYRDKWTNPESPFYPFTYPPFIPTQPPEPFPDTIKREEFEALKKEVEEMKKLLERAVEYDKRTNQPHCEMEDKVAILKKVAEAFGVDLKGLLENGSNGK